MRCLEVAQAATKTPATVSHAVIVEWASKFEAFVVGPDAAAIEKLNELNAQYQTGKPWRDGPEVPFLVDGPDGVQVASKEKVRKAVKVVEGKAP